MDKQTVITAAAGIEKLLAAAEEKARWAETAEDIRGLAHEINNARQIVAELKMLAESE